MNRPSKVDDLLGVWDAQGQFPLRSTDDVAHLVAWVKTLEQRNHAAQAHIDRARAHLDDWRATELVSALDVLRGDAGAWMPPDRLYGIHDDAEVLYLTEDDAVDWYMRSQGWEPGDPVRPAGECEGDVYAYELPAVVHEWTVRNNRDYFPSGRDLASHLVDEYSDGGGLLFGEELAAIDEDGRGADALMSNAVIELLDQAMKLAADTTRYWVADQHIGSVSVDYRAFVARHSEAAEARNAERRSTPEQNRARIDARRIA